MTSRPRLRLGSHLLPGIIAVVFIGLVSMITFAASWGQHQPFGADAGITASLGNALFNLETSIPSEGFLATFEIIDVVLVAALVGAIMLARRESGGEVLTALSSDDDPDGGDQ